MNTNEYLTPPQLAERWGVAADKVLQLIHSGQLRAVNLAVSSTGRPRYRISEAEIKRFEESRSSKPAVPVSVTRRRRAAAAPVKEFF